MAMVAAGNLGWAGKCKMISYRHMHTALKSGMTDIMFCDGHVKTVKTQLLVNPPRGSAQCLYDNGP